jgi:predicted N-formylglutamate amidohydrolase
LEGCVLVMTDREGMQAPAAVFKTSEALLDADEPPAAEVLNDTGRAPVLLVCDHASRAVPRRLAGLGLDEAMLLRHIGWDIGAAEVTRRLAAALDAPAVLSGYSRLVVDCNRFPDHASAMPEVSDGVVVPGNRGLSASDRARRLAACFAPYHRAIEERLAAFAARGVAPAIFSVHSFTPVMNGARRPWHVGILWDRDPRIAVPLMAQLGADPTRVVGDNEPYSAREPVGYTMRAHAMAAGLPHALAEIRQDLVDTPAGAAEWARILADGLVPILAREDLYRAERHS